MLNRGLALFIFAVAVVGCAAPSASPSVPSESVAAETLTVAPPPTDTPMPTATLTVIGSRATLLSVDGKGSKTSSPFAPSGSSVTVAYSFDCSAFGDGNLIADLMDANGVLVDELGNVGFAGSGKDSTTVDLANTSGPYRIEVNTECRWTVVVGTP